MIELINPIKSSNLTDQKIPHKSEFDIRMNICHYNNQILLKKFRIFKTQGVYARVDGNL